MSFDKPREVGAVPDGTATTHQRQARLVELGEHIRDQDAEIRSEIVFDAGRPVLFLLNPVVSRTEAVGCDLVDGREWWFTWPRHEDRTIGPADDPGSVSKVIARQLTDN